ncbi:hypothetical protein ACSBR2_026000 [Camellia fascicularis]
MLMAEPSTAVRFSSTASARFDSSTTSRRLSHSTRLFMPWNKFQRLADGSCMRRNSFVKNRVRASAEEQSGAASSPIKPNAKPSRYHPFEDIVESELMEGGDARLTPAEITRTIIEVNSKATLMFTGFVNEEVHDNIFWPDLPYVTDEYGNIYFQVKNDEDILKTLSAEDNLVVASDDPIDFMDQPPAGLAVQGLLRPAFIEEHSVIQKHISESNDQSGDTDSDQIERSVEDKVEDIGIINGQRHGPGSTQDSDIWAEELEKGESVRNGTSFYKLEMIKIQLISAHGHQTFVEVEDFRKARPDAIAHSAAKIISRLKAGGEKTTQALKSLCWRCKGIQVEEATLIGVDTLGFDLRICSGTQVQTLRFTFNKRASSEYSADRQLNDLLFPRSHHKLQKKKEARQTEL